MAKLTEKQLQALRAEQAGDWVYDDGGLRGQVRANKTGAVSVCFRWRYRFDGKIRSLACGTWPTKSLSAIRKARNEARRKLEDGEDPGLEKQATRLEKKAEQAARIAELEDRLARPTIRTLFNQWETLELANRKDKGAEVRRGFEKDVFPRIGDIAAEDVTRAHVMDVLDAILTRGKTRLANRVLSELRQMFGFGYVRDLVKNDPTHRIRKKDIGGTDSERDRILDESEIRELARKLPVAGLAVRTELAVWIMLSTCARVGELTRAAASHVDLQAGTWTIPAEHSKNGRGHTIYLSRFAAEQFEALLALDRSGDWLFPGRNPDSHMDLKAITRQVGDRQKASNQPESKKRVTSSALLLSGGKWTPHDLRRTGATLMGELGIRPDVIERCLNHTEERKVVRTYQRQELKPEQAEAWRLLGERLELLTEHDADNVVFLKGA